MIPTPDRPVTLIRGDCQKMLERLPADSIDAVISDPPYGLGAVPDAEKLLAYWIGGADYQTPGRGGFMGKKWDAFVPGPPVWRAIARVMKPGAPLFTFGGTRTYDFVCIAQRLAGLEILDDIHWQYGQGFPKSINLGRQLDMHFCTLPGRHGDKNLWKKPKLGDHLCPYLPAHDGWRAYGSAFKPGHEPIIFARKPLVGTYAENFLEHGTGVIHIAAGRMAVDDALATPQSDPESRDGVVGSDLGFSVASAEAFQQAQRESIERTNTLGRWPPNTVLSHSPDCVQTGVRTVGTGEKKIGGPPRSNVGHKLSAGNGDRSEAVMGYGAEAVPVYECAAVYRVPESFYNCGPGDMHAVCSHCGWRNAFWTARDSVFSTPVLGMTCECGQIFDFPLERVRWLCPVAAMDEQSGIRTSGFMAAGTQRASREGADIFGGHRGAPSTKDTIADSGGASRYYPTFNWDPEIDTPFLYCSKPSKAEKDAGCAGLPLRSAGEVTDREDGSTGLQSPRAGAGRTSGGRNHHPTVKPVALLQWLCRLSGQPEGVILDPFVGSGTTGVAAVREGFRFVGIDLDDDGKGGSAGYLAIAGARITHALEAAHRQADADDRDLDAG